jgi:TPR repeat protein
MEKYYPCCGKSICLGCSYSFCKSGNDDKCPFCNSDRASKTLEEFVEEIMKRVAANDAGAIWMLGNCYHLGLRGGQQDQAKAMELYGRAAELGCSKAHNNLADIYHDGGALKKAKFHSEAAAMAGDEAARCNLGSLECNSGKMERAIKHWTIAASAGEHCAMNYLRESFEKGHVSRESIDKALTAYNKSCAEVRSEARDAYISVIITETI